VWADTPGAATGVTWLWLPPVTRPIVPLFRALLASPIISPYSGDMLTSDLTTTTTTGGAIVSITGMMITRMPVGWME
jgi:hypothetical protein